MYSPEEELENCDEENVEQITEVEFLSDSLYQLQDQMDVIQSQVDQLMNNKTEVIKNKDNTINTVHQHVRCDKCNVSPIRGKRYKCLICLDYDHCENCEIEFPHEHDMIVLKKQRNH